jgi:mono/diheme cytochrome c family protein
MVVLPACAACHGRPPPRQRAPPGQWLAAPRAAMVVTRATPAPLRDGAPPAGHRSRVEMLKMFKHFQKKC